MTARNQATAVKVLLEPKWLRIGLYTNVCGFGSVDLEVWAQMPTAVKKVVSEVVASRPSTSV